MDIIHCISKAYVQIVYMMLPKKVTFTGPGGQDVDIYFGDHFSTPTEIHTHTHTYICVNKRQLPKDIQTDRQMQTATGKWIGKESYQAALTVKHLELLC